MKSLTYILFCACLLISVKSYSQQVIIKADTVAAIPGDSVTVAITYHNMNNIGSVTLFIEFNSSFLKWGRALNWNPGFNNGFNFANASGNTLAITCLNTNGFSGNQGKLLDLRFKYSLTGNLSLLAFKPSCEVTDVSGNPLTTLYQNGFVVKQIDVAPTAVPAQICLGSASQLNANATGMFDTYSYNWASNPPGFSSSEGNPIVSPSVTTRYFVTATFGSHNDTGSVLVTVLSLVPPDPVSSMFPANGAVNLDNPVNLSWAPSANATNYDVYIWPASGTQPTTPSFGNLTQISCSIGNLSQGITYNWRVVSKNSCFQVSGSISSFTMRAFPDLHITQVSTSAAYAGQPIEISWTVRNDGLGTTMEPVWYDRVWVSPDIEVRVGEPNDILLGTFQNISYLAPGESYTQTQTFTLPINLIGTYYIFVITDALDALFINWPTGAPQLPYSPPPYAFGWTHGGSGVNLVQEASDNGASSDNFFYKEINLITPPLPDLKVVNILKPASIFSGQNITVTWTVLNDGEATTTAGSWSDRIFLTQDTALNPSTASILGTFSHTGSLEPDSIYMQSATVTIPNYILGNYFIYVYTDIYDNVFEHVYEANNITRSDTLKIFLTPPPDLIVTNVDIPASASVKENIEIKFSVLNQGATATTQSYWMDMIYISQNPVWDIYQSQLIGAKHHGGNLGSFSSYSAQFNVQVAATFTGDWYIYVYTDKNNNVFEYNNENNNVTRSNATISFFNPDLVPVSITGPQVDSADAPAVLSWYDKNLGPGKVLNSSWNDKLYLSLNAVFDVNSSVYFTNNNCNYAILPGDSLLRQKSSLLPNVNSGLYYLYVFADGDNSINEAAQEDNNIDRSQTTIEIRRADLAVASILGDTLGQSGMPVSLNVAIQNIGSGNVVNKEIKDRLYLCPGLVFDSTTAINLGTQAYTCNVNAQGSYARDWNVTLPDGITGTFYLACRTDIENKVKEGTYEGNNLYISSSPFYVSDGPWADLEPVSVSCPPSVIAGNPINFSYAVTNTGTKQTPVNSWKDKIYKSASPVWNIDNATLVKTIDRIEPLAIDSSYTITTIINISPNQAAGPLYFFVFTDALNNVFENTDETNNVSSPVTLQVLPYPLDIQIFGPQILGTTYNSGQSFQYSYQVTNVSIVNTTVATWYDALYLSTDTVFSPANDIQVNKWIHSGSLSPGTSYNLSKILSVPNGIQGSYYLIGITDLENQNHDILLANNAKVIYDTTGVPMIIDVILTPSPDLDIVAFSSPSQVTAGQLFKIYYTVRNLGPGDVNGNWKDKLYLSQDFVINSGDNIVATRSHSGLLHPNEEYSDSMEVVINQNISANYILILKTDAENNIYEYNAEENNISTNFLIVAQPPPVDLWVSSITLPSVAVVGETVSISWEIRNQGSNNAIGSLKDGVYFSLDTLLDATDLLWYQYQGNINIAPNTNVTRTANLVIPGLALGSYHIIVRTDMTNFFLETDESNNRTVSASLITLDFESLQLGVTENAVLPDLANLYYKLLIPDSLEGESFLLTLKGDSINGNNEIYASFNGVPSRIHYQYRNSFYFEGNQELIIPSLTPGLYYFLVTGNTTSGNQQNIILKPEVLAFEVRSIDMNHGGNLGNVTVRIRGSKFTPQTTFSLVKDTCEINGSDLIFINSSEVVASFALYSSGIGSMEWDFVEVPYGFYDVKASKPDGSTAVLENGFEVVPYVQPELIANIQYPSSVRPNRFFTMSIQFANTGNADIDIPIRSLLSLYDAPIGFTTEDLLANLFDLLLEFREPGGSTTMLRPGAVSEIKVHCKSSSRLVFKLVK